MCFLPATTGAAAARHERRILLSVKNKNRQIHNAPGCSLLLLLPLLPLLPAALAAALLSLFLPWVVGTFVARGETTKSFRRRLFGQRKWTAAGGAGESKGLHYSVPIIDWLIK